MVNWDNYLADASRAFLMDNFEDDEEMYTKTLKGFEDEYAMGTI